MKKADDCRGGPWKMDIYEKSCFSVFSKNFKPT